MGRPRLWTLRDDDDEATAAGFDFEEGEGANANTVAGEGDMSAARVTVSVKGFILKSDTISSLRVVK